MKKILILALGAAAALGLLTGCSDDESHFEARRYTPDASVNGVCVDVSDRELQVSLSDDNLVHIDYFESEDAYYNISVSEDGILTMTAESGEGISQFFGVKSSGEEHKISLQVPSGLLASLELHTTNEDITLAALAVTDRITLSNNRGDISFDALDVGNSLQLENKNGDISGTILGSEDEFSISTESKKGESSLPASREAGEKTLHVTNNNGDIAVAFSAAAQ